ncbi:retrovirus-related pol polyprotein from transposon TNT 1-94 [Tanacetum coccineum]
MQEVVLFYNGLDVPTRQILDSRSSYYHEDATDANAIQAQLNNLGREIKKVNEKVDAAQLRIVKNEGDYIATVGIYTKGTTQNLHYQERRQSMEETLSKFMSESAKRHEENSNLIKESRASKDAGIRNQGASIKILEIQIGQMSKVLQERGFGGLPSSTKPNPRDHVKSISTTVEADTNLIHCIGSPQYAVSTPQNRRLMFESRQMTIPFPTRLNDYYCKEKKGSYGPKFSKAYSYEASHIDNSIPRKEKDPGSFTLPCYINNVCFDDALADLGASVSVMPLSTYLNLGLGELAHTKLTVKLADRTVKYPKGIAENVLVGIGKFVFPVDIIILDMPEDVKVPLILGRPFFLIKRVYMLGLRERMELDLEARLMGETLVLHRSLDPLYGDYIELNDLNVPLELRRDQVDDLMPTIEEGEVIDEPMIDIIKTRNNESFDKYPSFCDFDRKIHIDCAYNLRFSCMIVVENIDGYRDQDMGDIILGEPHCKASCVEARRFKHLSNAQCNKVKPLLKVSMHDKHNGISHPYQKLKGFYKGVLNLGPEYVRDAKMEEWLTHGHVSVHEME